MRYKVILLALKERLKDPRLIIALAALALSLLGCPVLADEDDPELPGIPYPSPDPTC